MRGRTTGTTESFSHEFERVTSKRKRSLDARHASSFVMISITTARIRIHGTTYGSAIVTTHGLRATCTCTAR